MDIAKAKQDIFWKAIAVNTSTGYLKRLHRQILEELDAGGFTGNLYDGYYRTYIQGTWSILYNGATTNSIVEINPTQFTRDANEYLGVYAYSGFNEKGIFYQWNYRQSGDSSSYRIRNEYAIQYQPYWRNVDGTLNPSTFRYFLFPKPDSVRALSTPDFFKHFINNLTMYYSTGWQQQSFWSQVKTGLAQGLATGLSIYLGGSTGGSYIAQALALGINYASYKKTQEQQAEYDAYMNKIEDIRTERSKKEEEDSKKVKFDNSFQKDYNYDIRYEDYSDRGLYENYTLTYEKY